MSTVVSTIIYLNYSRSTIALFIYLAVINNFIIYADQNMIVINNCSPVKGAL